MRKIVKIILVCVLVFVSVGIFLIGYLYFNQSKIKNYFIGKLNEQIGLTISIQEIAFDFFKQFPNVSLDLKMVNVSHQYSERKPLLTAEHIFIGFNIYDILSKNYRIKKVSIDSGSICIIRDKSGKFNFSGILKDTSAKDGNIFFQLDQVKISRTQFEYSDQYTNQKYLGLIENSSLSGSLEGKISEISCNANLFVEKIKNNKITVLKDKRVLLDWNAIYDSQKESITFKHAKVKLENLKLELTGLIKNNTDDIFIDLSVKAKQTTITEIVSLFPVKPDLLNKFESSGEVYFTGVAKGNMSRKNNALFQIDFGIKNGALTNKLSHLKIEKINFVGRLSNGDNKNSLTTTGLELKGISIQIKNGELNGELSITNFYKPFISASFKGNIDLADVLQLVKIKTIKEGNGNINFDLNLKGNAEDLSSQKSFLKTESSGKLHFDLKNIKFENSDLEISSVSSSIVMHHHDGEINTLNLKLNKSDISLQGKFINLIPYLFSDNQKLTAELLTKSDFIDIENFIIPLNSDSSKNSSPFQLPKNVSVTAKMTIGKLIFHKFSASNSFVSINWNDKKITFPSVMFQTMNGTMTSSGSIENTNDDRFLVSVKATLKTINLNELFSQCNNFGQTQITNKNLYGNLNATIDLVSVWSSKGDCDFSKLYAFSDIRILNGELIGYKPLEGLSKYANVEDLRHLKFSELKNQIEIKNRMINIPSMDLKNNALNLSISGTHSFENIVDYKIKIKLSELLWKKRKQKTNDFNEEQEAQNQGLYLYLTMKGLADNAKFSYDKFSVKNKIKQEIKDEKLNFKEILKKELGIKKDSTIHEKKNESEEMEFEKD